MLSLINWRLKVTINDGRAFVGQMLAFDRHMNLVLAECEEFRRIRPKKKPGETEAGPVQEMKRTLGLVILRGETVVSLSVEGPPPVVDDDKKNMVRTTLCQCPRCADSLTCDFQLPFGPGRGAPAGRGMGMMPPSAFAVRSSARFPPNLYPPHSGCARTTASTDALRCARRTRHAPGRLQAARLPWCAARHAPLCAASRLLWSSSRVRRSHRTCSRSEVLTIPCLAQIPTPAVKAPAQGCVLYLFFCSLITDTKEECFTAPKRADAELREHLHGGYVDAFERRLSRDWLGMVAVCVQHHGETLKRFVSHHAMPVCTSLLWNGSVVSTQVCSCDSRNSCLPCQPNANAQTILHARHQSNSTAPR